MFFKVILLDGKNTHMMIAKMSFAFHCNVLFVAPSCRSGEFRCQDGRCIPEDLKCDGRQDCRGGEDEQNCGN